MRGVACDLQGRLVTGRRMRVEVTRLVAKTLGSNDGDLIANALVGLEIESEFWVVAFDDDFG